jgi:serine/threonine-protein kinase
MPQPTTDRNLLFGILALQMDFIRRDELIAAMQAWVLDKDKPLGQILCTQGVLSDERRALLDALVQEHLKQHGDDPRHSLAAVSSVRPVRPSLEQIDDADVQASLSSVRPGPHAEETRDDRAPSGNGARYRILRPHAKGGLGEVFVAEDTELHREVALKEIRPQRADDPVSRGRFLLEAEITGGLEHPGIVPVYGLGVYPDGRPYYAMRLIRGDTLKQAVEQFHGADQPGRDPGERRLAFRQLLRRFVDVCNAVAYAHSRGVLHRDLKPANVLLGPFGETLVVDWGLAKAGVSTEAGADSTDEPTVEAALRPASGSVTPGTQAGATLGTPSYMSPEQAEGRLHELSPASDIYSLGATLYVVLTGRTPHAGADADAVLARVRRGDIAPPRQVKPDTPPALDAVCRKAMALRPADRYATALDLAADVEHWLADEPVAAYPEPWTARAARWGRRHRTLLVAAAVLLASAVVALSATTALVWREQLRTAEQRRLAEQNYELARDLSFNGITLIAASEASFAADPGLHSARKELLKAAARGFRQYLEQQPNDPELRQRTAQVYRYTANVHRLTNETEPAEALYRDALRLYEGLADERPGEAVHRERLSETLRDYANLQSRLGRLREAGDTLGRAVALAEQLRAEDADRPGYRRTLAAALLSRASVEHSRGLTAEAAATARQAADLFRELLALPPGAAGPYDPLLLAAALNIVAITERDAGRLDAARSLHNEAIKHLQGMLDKGSSTVNKADVLYFMASCRMQQCRTWARTPERRANAETNLGAAALQWEGLARNYPAIPMYRADQAVALYLRGQLRADGNRADEARADFDKSRQLLEDLVKEFPQIPGYRGDLGRTYAGLGRLAGGAGDEAGAANWLGKAAEALRQAVEQSPDSAENRRSLEEVRNERPRP